MSISENFRIALRALAANKMRSVLTMLGIIIGVGAVVALIAIGNGATASITGQVQGIGSNLISVMPGQLQPGSGGQGGLTANLYRADYEALARTLTEVEHVVPLLQNRLNVTQNKTSGQVSIIATLPEYAAVRSYTIAYGRMFSAGENRAGARVVVLGSQTATDFFGGLNPVGRTIKIEGQTYTVVGVLKEKGSSGFTNEDDVVLAPLETGYDWLGGAAVVNGRQLVTGVMISAATPESVNDVMVQTRRVLRREHGLGPSDENDFSVISQTQLMDTLSAITTTLTIFLGAIAGISLLVGGIGIMNIMLVSVTERTREIGLRKAVGARRSVILMQFLVETLVLSIAGGVLGIALGWAIAAGVTAANLIAAQVTVDSMALAFIFSAAVGLFFGIYPAFRASKLRPIEALRYE